MLTKKLNQTYTHTKKLVDFLESRDWINADELTDILKKADREIDAIVDKAISDVLTKLQGSYSKEARLWAANKMTNISGKGIIISAAECKSAKVDLNKIKIAIKNITNIGRY